MSSPSNSETNINWTADTVALEGRNASSCQTIDDAAIYIMPFCCKSREVRCVHSAIDISSFFADHNVLFCRLEAKSALQRDLAVKYH